MGKIRIRQGAQLIDHRGHLVAGSGELVADDHPAVLAHPDIASVGDRVPEPQASAPAERLIDPGVDTPVADLPADPMSFGNPHRFGRRH